MTEKCFLALKFHPCTHLIILLENFTLDESLPLRLFNATDVNHPPTAIFVLRRSLPKSQLVVNPVSFVEKHLTACSASKNSKLAKGMRVFFCECVCAECFDQHCSHMVSVYRGSPWHFSLLLSVLLLSQIDGTEPS